MTMTLGELGRIKLRKLFNDSELMELDEINRLSISLNLSLQDYSDMCDKRFPMGPRDNV